MSLMSLKRGLYAITDEKLLADRLLPAVSAAIQGGAVAVQYRRKTGSAPEQRHEAEALLALCREHHIPLIINDDIELALCIGADGVHLGREDGDLRHARKQLGNDAIIGATCHDSLEFAAEAAAHGANYLAFGTVYSSPTKPHAPSAPLSLFQDARHFGLPLVAIGGIKADNAAPVVTAGADCLAVISDLWLANDIAEHARRLSRLYA